MRKRTRWLPVLGLAAFLVGCAVSSPREGTITQISVLDALLAGDYDGTCTCAQLLEYGDTGLGTFQALDGEMIVLDGEIFQARADGTVSRPDPDLPVPFAAVCRFPETPSLSSPAGLDYEQFQAWLDGRLGNLNVPRVIRLRGRFPAMKVRSVPRQEKPYPPLAEVAAHQPVFEFKDVAGTVVGFRLPPYVKGINVPGYHLHFISDDRSRGGHILDFRTGENVLEIAPEGQFTIVLPVDAGTFAAVDFSRDREAEMHKVER